MHMKSAMASNIRTKSSGYHRVNVDRKAAFEAVQSIIESSICNLCVQRRIFPKYMFASMVCDDSKLLLFKRELLDSSCASKNSSSNRSEMCLSSLSWGGSLNTWVRKANSNFTSRDIDFEWQMIEAKMILDWLESNVFSQMTCDQTNRIIFNIVRGSDNEILEKYELTFTHRIHGDETTCATLLKKLHVLKDVDVVSLPPTERYLSLKRIGEQIDHVGSKNGHISSKKKSITTKRKSSFYDCHRFDDCCSSSQSSSPTGPFSKSDKRLNKRKILSKRNIHSHMVKDDDQEEILPNDVSVYAIPFFPLNDSRSKNIHLPCKVIGHRYQNGMLQYKLSFSDQVLDQNRMRKQWRDKKRIILKDTIISAIMSEVDRYGDLNEDELASRIHVEVDVIHDIMNQMNSEKLYKDFESVGDCSTNQYVYSYFFPITVTL